MRYAGVRAEIPATAGATAFPVSFKHGVSFVSPMFAKIKAQTGLEDERISALRVRAIRLEGFREAKRPIESLRHLPGRY